jgi:hypothetical protein
MLFQIRDIKNYLLTLKNNVNELKHVNDSLTLNAKISEIEMIILLIKRKYKMKWIFLINILKRKYLVIYCIFYQKHI